MFLKFTTSLLILVAVVTAEPTSSKEAKPFKKSHFTGRRIETSEVHVASKREAAPEPIYGVPAEPVYGPPAAAPPAEYGPPQQEYGPPQQEYEAPAATGPAYGPPATAPEYGPPAAPVYGPPGHNHKHKPEEVSLTEFLWDVFKSPIKTSITTAHKYDKKHKGFSKILGLGVDFEFGKPKTGAKYAPSHNYGDSKVPSHSGKVANGSPLYATIDTNVFGEYGKGKEPHLTVVKKEEGWNAQSNSYGPPSSDYGAPSGPSGGSNGWAAQQFDANVAIEKLQNLCRYIGSGSNW